jgi:hypothetical protein
MREFDSFRMLVTGDENWFVLEYQHSAKWSVARDEVPTRMNETISTGEMMLTVIWGIDGLHVIDMIPPGVFSTPTLCWRKPFQRKGKAMHFD